MVAGLGAAPLGGTAAAWIMLGNSTPASRCSVVGLSNTNKYTIQSIFTLQKRAIRIIHNAGYRNHRNSLFLKSKTLKFTHLVQF